MPAVPPAVQIILHPKDAQGKDITWRNAAALEGYVRRLSDVADRLAERNRQLRKWHDVLREKVRHFTALCACEWARAAPGAT
jgi:hypothetical protein